MLTDIKNGVNRLLGGGTQGTTSERIADANRAIAMAHHAKKMAMKEEAAPVVAAKAAANKGLQKRLQRRRRRQR